MPIPEGYVTVDTDDEYYKREDTEWLVEPDDEDPGVLGPKSGAISFAEAQAEKVCTACDGECSNIEPEDGSYHVCGHCRGTGDEPASK